ncbi:MAG: hypothetical protein SYR96_04435 [Actinomycetota bacterium]|nr:hypothetical protein [Actinomycetota bacterium]
MDRGPLALFGAIVAVGLGPALWMGVQLGGAGGESPARPPVVREQGATEKSGQNLVGGAGAGEQTGGAITVTETRADVRPLTTSPSAEPSPSASSEPEPSASTTTTTPATATAEPTATTEEPELPPTESTTTAPTSAPAETTEPPVDEATAPPSPPPSDDKQ